MIKKYKLFWRPDQNNSRTNHRKNMLSSKMKFWAVHAKFSPRRHEVDETRLNLRKIPKLSQPCSKFFGNQLQKFRSKCNTRKFRSKTWNTANTKIHPLAETTIPIKTMKKKTSSKHFAAFLSEPYFTTSSMTCIHLEKFKVFSSPRQPETHFRHAQGHQRGSSLTGSINIFQSTVITVCEVEHRKTVNPKHGKQTIWFSEVIKDFHHYLYDK